MNVVSVFRRRKMAACIFTTIILSLLMETCYANLETIEFKLGDRKIRIPLSQLTQSENVEDIKLLVPDQEENSNSYVRLQPAQSPLTVGHPLPSHSHIPRVYHDSSLSNINYPPPSNNVYARHHPNQYPETQFPRFYQQSNQQSPNQYYPVRHDQSEQHSQQKEPPRYHTNYNHPYHIPNNNAYQVSPLQRQPYPPPYPPNYGYPTVNYLSNRFPEWQPQYQARPYLSENNNYGNINPNIYPPRAIGLQNRGDILTNLDSTKSQGKGSWPLQNPSQNVQMSSKKNNALQRSPELQNSNFLSAINTPQVSASKTEDFSSKSEQFSADSSALKDDIRSRYFMPNPSKRFVRLEPASLVQEGKHNLVQKNNLKNEAVNVHSINAPQDLSIVDRLPKQRNAAYSSAMLNNLMPMITKDNALIQNPTNKPEPITSMNLPIDVQNIIADFVATPPPDLNTDILPPLEALPLNEASKINSLATLPPSETNTERVVTKLINLPQELRTIDILIPSNTMLPQEETKTNSPEISTAIPYITVDAFEQNVQNKPLVQDTTIANFPENIPVQLLNVSDFTNKPVSDIKNLELFKQNIETDSPLLNIATESLTQYATTDNPAPTITEVPFNLETTIIEFPNTKVSVLNTANAKTQEIPLVLQYTAPSTTQLNSKESFIDDNYTSVTFSPKENSTNTSKTLYITTYVPAQDTQTTKVLEESTTNIPLISTTTLQILARGPYFATEEPTPNETTELLPIDTSIFFPITLTSAQDINTPETFTQYMKTDYPSFNVVTESRTNAPIMLLTTKDPKNNTLEVFLPNQYITLTEPVANLDANVLTELTEVHDTDSLVIVYSEQNAGLTVSAGSIEFTTEATELVTQNTTVINTEKESVATTQSPHRRRPCKKHQKTRADGKSEKSGRRRRRRRTTTARPLVTTPSAPSTSTNASSTITETVE